MLWPTVVHLVLSRPGLHSRHFAKPFISHKIEFGNLYVATMFHVVQECQRGGRRGQAPLLPFSKIVKDARVPFSWNNMLLCQMLNSIL